MSNKLLLPSAIKKTHYEAILRCFKKCLWKDTYFTYFIEMPSAFTYKMPIMYFTEILVDTSVSKYHLLFISKSMQNFNR